MFEMDLDSHILTRANSFILQEAKDDHIPEHKRRRRAILPPWDSSPFFVVTSGKWRRAADYFIAPG